MGITADDWQQETDGINEALHRKYAGIGFDDARSLWQGVRNAAGTLQHLNERVADARLRARRGDRLERIQRRRGLREAEQAHFERVFELRERSIL